MPVRLPGPVVVLDGRDCAVLNRPFGELVVALQRRDGYVPRALVELVEEIRRAAIQFRDETLSSDPGSGTVFDTPCSGTRVSSVSEVLTATQAAAMTEVSRELICRLAVKGVLKGTKTGRRGGWELSSDSVAAWQAARRERASKAA